MGKGMLTKSYNVSPLIPRKEWIILVDGDRIGTVRHDMGRYGWQDKQGGHWFSTFDIAAEAKVAGQK
jgi:hypothetical protein